MPRQKLTFKGRGCPLCPEFILLGRNPTSPKILTSHGSLMGTQISVITKTDRQANNTLAKAETPLLETYSGKGQDSLLLMCLYAILAL